MNKRSRFSLFIIYTLIIALLLPINVTAAVSETAQPRASSYLAAYTAYICAMGDGELQIWWNVYGSGTQVDLGVLRIVLYESSDNVTWTWVKTFTHSSYTNMLSHNDYHHMDYVSFQGTEGYYYKAYVTIYGGNGTTGDCRYIWTPVELAT